MDTNEVLVNSKKELEKVFLEYLKIEKQFEESLDELRKETSPERIVEAFKDVGEIDVDRGAYDKICYNLSHPLFNTGRHALIATNDKAWPEFIWEKPIYLDNECWGIDHFEQDVDWCKFMTIPTFHSLDELKNYTKQVEELINKLNKAIEKYNPLNLKIKVFELRKLKDEAYQKVEEAYERYQEAFFEIKYGEPLGKIVVGKQYFMLDDSNETVALVEVTEQNPSGLGFTCVDHEAGDKPYYHVDPLKLRLDHRDLETIYDFRQRISEELKNDK